MNRKGFYFDDDPDAGAGSQNGDGQDKQKDQKTTDQKDQKPPDQKDDKKPATIPYERFDEVNTKYKTAQQELDDLKAKQKKAEEDGLKEQNKWKELYETKEKDAKAKEKELLRLKIAMKKGLPEEFVNRLMGETEQELEADADKLLTFVKEGAPGMPPKKPGGAANHLEISGMTPEEIRKNAGKLLEQERAGKTQ